MSRGTTRRSAFGRRTRTLPNSSRSVTTTRPSGPPAKPALRLRPTRATAPGGGAPGRIVTPTGIPASPRSSARRGAWSDASTIRGAGAASRRLPRAPPRPGLATAPGGSTGRGLSASSSASGTEAGRPARHRSTARARPALRPGGRTGSRQPNGSSSARPPPIASTGPGSQPSSRVRAPSSRAFHSRGGRYASGQASGRSPAATRSRRRSAAWSHRNSAAAATSPGSSTTRSVPGSTRSRPLAGHSTAAHTSAASPTSSARAPAAEDPAATAPGPAPGSPSRRARSAARRSDSRPARRPSRSRMAAGPPAGTRNSLAGRSSTSSTARIVRWSVGSKTRISSTSSPNSSIRTGRSAPAGKTSTRPPRRAISPRPATSTTGSCPSWRSSARRSAWRTRSPRRRTRGRSGRSSGGRVGWRSAWTDATRTRARPLRQRASVATRAADSSRMSSLRSYASAVRGSRTATAAGSPSQAVSSSATRSPISASRAIQQIRSPAPRARAATRNDLAPCGTAVTAACRPRARVPGGTARSSASRANAAVSRRSGGSAERSGIRRAVPGAAAGGAAERPVIAPRRPAGPDASRSACGARRPGRAARRPRPGVPSASRRRVEAGRR